MNPQPRPEPDRSRPPVPEIPTAGGGDGGNGRKKYDRKPPKAMSKEQVRQLIAATKANLQTWRRDAAMVQFMYDTAARASEVGDLRLDGIDWERERIDFGRRKSKDSISLRVWPSTLDALRRYLAWRKQTEGRMFLPPDEPVFRSTAEPYGPLNRRAIQKIILRNCKRAGLPRQVSKPHAIRHGRAVAMIEDGAPLITVQRRLGHRSLATTQHYLDVCKNVVDDYAQETGRL